MICKISLSVIWFLNELELISLHTSIASVCKVKWVQLLLSTTYNSIQMKSFVCTKRIGYKYGYLTLIILLITIHSFVHS